MFELNDAYNLAKTHHMGQLDKLNIPYINHPVSVMLKLLDKGITNEEILMAALLHDVVEDTPATLESLEAEGVPTRVLVLIDYLTRRKDEVYADYIKRVGKSAEARVIKIADILHNLERLTPAMKGLGKRYEKALIMLGEMSK